MPTDRRSPPAARLTASVVRVRQPPAAGEQRRQVLRDADREADRQRDSSGRSSIGSLIRSQTASGGLPSASALRA